MALRKTDDEDEIWMELAEDLIQWEALALEELELRVLQSHS
jgi:hypothetical protein